MSEKILEVIFENIRANEEQYEAMGAVGRDESDED